MSSNNATPMASMNGNSKRKGSLPLGLGSDSPIGGKGKLA